MSFRRALLALFGPALLFCLPGQAVAADYFVAPGGSDAGPCSAAAPCATISHVVGLPAVQNGDAVRLAAGVYPESVSTAKILIFIGAGPGTRDSASGASVIRSPTADPALTMTRGGVLGDLRIRGHDEAGAAGVGLVLGHAPGVPVIYGLSRLLVLGGDDVAAGSGANAIEIDCQGSGPIRINAEDVFAESLLAGASAMSLDGSCGANIYATLERMFLLGGDHGLAMISGTELEISNSLVSAEPVANGLAAIEIEATPETRVLAIRNSTVVTRTSAGNQDGLRIVGQTGTELIARLVNSIIRVRAADGSGSNGDELQTELDSPGGAINLTALHSSFNSVNALDGTALPAAGSGTNIAGNPGLVSFPNGNYGLDPGSPLIDRGDPGEIRGGELDRTGFPRSLDSNQDCIAAPELGAFEVIGLAESQPTVSFRASPPLARKGEAVQFIPSLLNGYRLSWSFSDGGSAVGSVVEHRFDRAGRQTARLTAVKGACFATATGSVQIDGTAPMVKALKLRKRILRFHLSEDSRVTVAVKRKQAGRRKFVKLGSFTFAGKRGARTRKLPGSVRGRALRSGKFVFTVRAIDRAGNRSRGRSVSASL